MDFPRVVLDERIVNREAFAIAIGRCQQLGVQDSQVCIVRELRPQASMSHTVNLTGSFSDSMPW